MAYTSSNGRRPPLTKPTASGSHSTGLRTTPRWLASPSICRHVSPFGVGLLITALIAVTAMPARAEAAHQSYDRVAIEEAGISLAVPDTWDVDEMTRAEARTVIKNNPQFEDYTADELVKDTPLAARWDGDGDGFPDRWLSVRVVPDANLVPSPTSVQSELRGVIDDVVAKRTNVAGRSALMVNGSATITRDDGTDAHAYARAYMFLVHSHLVAVQYFRAQNNDPVFDSMTATMIKSVKVLK